MLETKAAEKLQKSRKTVICQMDVLHLNLETGEQDDKDEFYNDEVIAKNLTGRDLLF